MNNWSLKSPKKQTYVPPSKWLAPKKEARFCFLERFPSNCLTWKPIYFLVFGQLWHFSRLLTCFRCEHEYQSCCILWATKTKIMAFTFALPSLKAPQKTGFFNFVIKSSSPCNKVCNPNENWAGFQHICDFFYHENWLMILMNMKLAIEEWIFCACHHQIQFSAHLEASAFLIKMAAATHSQIYGL